jgi:nicotinate dehydrogenase subunit B
MRAAHAPATRAGFLQATGVLLVVRDPPPPAPPAPGQPPMVPGNPAEGVEILLAVWDDGSATGLAGKVDLGTGIATALGQLVAEELGLPFERVRMVLGDTARAPNQGPTIASATLQIAAGPLRQAAAQAGAWVRAELNAPVNAPVEAQAASHVASQDHSADITTSATALAPGSEHPAEPDFHALLAGRHIRLVLDPSTPPKPSTDWTVAGQSLPRVDIPAKVLGEAAFVHDVAVPGMLHGRVLRPPYAGADHGDFIGRTLRGVDEGSIGHIPGVVAIVREGDFVGVVAEREEQAEAAMRALQLDWGDWPAQPPLDDLAAALSANPATPRVVAEQGDAAAANATAPLRLTRTYVWPYQMHASIGPSCAVAHWLGPDVGPGADPGDLGAGPSAPRDAHRLRVWAGSQNPHVLRADLALLTGLPDTAVDIMRLEAAGCYGRNGADDVAADAALLSRAVGRPVRVQLTREQEHQWEPKGAAQRMDVDGSVGIDGRLQGWDFSTCYPSNAAPTLALLLTGRVAATAQAYAMGDRTSVPPYQVPNLKVTVNDMPPILRASWLRGVSALPNSFAHESFIDELAIARGEDPLAFRLQHLGDVRAAELLHATADKAGWQPRTAPRQRSDDGVILKGQGLAYARYIHSKFPGFGAAWSAWVADVEVNKLTGEVHVSRVVVGHDAGAMVNPAGVTHQVHGNVVQTTSRALQERVEVEPTTGAVASREWGSYPILSFRQVPVIEVVVPPRPGEPILGAGESSSVPGTAAIANAIFDATGVRFRQPPFTPEVVRAALNPLGDATRPPFDGDPATPGDNDHVAWGTAAGAEAAAGWQASMPAAVIVPTDNGAAVDWRSPHGAVTPAGTATEAQPSATTGPSGPAVSTARKQPPGPSPWADVVSPEPFRPLPGAPRAKPLWARAIALVGGTVAALAGLVGWTASRPALAPVAGVHAASTYTAATIERGRQLAALGNCGGCHTDEGGAPYAGGRRLDTPFGTIVSTNLTPDPTHGIGRWSFSAFQRAMREGVSHDGRHLYPAFPYTAFTRMTDADLTALYAYLMQRPAVAHAPPPSELRFPFNLRPLMALWNALHLQPGPRAVAAPVGSVDTVSTVAATPLSTSHSMATSPTPPEARGTGMPAGSQPAPAAPSMLDAALWQRGEYLVNGPGHCGACHTPRDALGAERTGTAYLTGAVIDGWHAPSLTAAQRRTLPWSEQSLFEYLRQGHSALHGVAVGPMAEVVSGLADAPDADLRAMAHYLASLQATAPAAALPDHDAITRLAEAAVQRARALAPLPGATQRMFETACGACHQDGGRAPVDLGLNLPLALNGKLRADTPDNLLRVMLDGIQRPATREIAFMPGFREALDDRQLAELAVWMRQRFAPDRPPWGDAQALARQVAEVRGTPRVDR